ncbi:MAG: heparinase II/III-family protein [Streptosporangiales bacterium]|nr:heparinase II/III-family protein [Streptosporangiales bacterium]
MRARSGKLLLSALATGLLTALTSCGALTSVLPGTPARTVPGPAAKACGFLPPFREATAEEIMAGRLTISPFKPVTVDPARDGNVDWRQDPYHHPTWRQDFQSGGWIEMLISGYLAGGPRSGAYRARAEALTRSWLKHVPVGDRDPETVICLSEGFPGQKWIDDQIAASVNYLAGHWQGPWNHGLVQDLKLMRIGCAYPATAFGGAARRWRKTADRQILSSFYDSPRLGPSVDAQGAVNEQATGYERFVYDLWRGGEPELRACGYRLPGGVRARIGKMADFLAEAGQPDGNLVQIGDTYAESSFLPPRPRLPKLPLVAVYQAGYVFGRSAWGAGGTFYSLRFGRPRQVHGHNDHLGVTYYARGRNLIVDAGHTGYEDGSYRDYIRSPEAASTFLSASGPFRASQPSSLVTDRIGRTSQYYRLADQAIGGHRTRSVYVHDGPDFALVLDQGSGERRYQQLWHLDPSLTARAAGGGSATASAPAVPSRGVPATLLHLLRVPVPGGGAPGAVRVVKGQKNPYQGWVSRQALQRTPAPVVIMNGDGTGAGLSTAMLTLIAATAPGTPVSATAKRHGRDYDVRVRAGTVTTTVSLPCRGPQDAAAC